MLERRENRSKIFGLSSSNPSARKTTVMESPRDHTENTNADATVQGDVQVQKNVPAECGGTGDAEPESMQESKAPASEAKEEGMKEKLEGTPASEAENDVKLDDIIDTNESTPEATEIDSEPKPEDTNDSQGPTEDTDETDPDEIKEKAEEWTFILGHERLKKKTLKEGKGHETRPTHRQIVTIRLEGKLEDGTVVDKNEEVKFTMGDGEIIQALDLAIALSELEETALVHTEASYAYGSHGRAPDIPPDASITYEVEVLKVEDPVIVSELSLDERKSTGESKRERGNYHFSRKDYALAIQSYTRALEFLSLENVSEPSLEELDQLNDIKMKCFNNKAASQIKIDAWDACIASCDEVLKLEKNNVKALFRKGKATASKGDIEDAISILRHALEIDPKSKIIHQELSTLTNRRNKMVNSEREMCKRMWAPKKDESQKKDTKSGWSGGTFAAMAALAAGVLSVGIAMYRSSQ